MVHAHSGFWPYDAIGGLVVALIGFTILFWDFIRAYFDKKFKEPCPNCWSADQIGKEPNWCLICSDPKTGEIRGWVWKNTKLHAFLVSRRNVKKLETQACPGED